jgi:hypothetical protein
MVQDTLKYDSLNVRPLPKWLTDERDGLNTLQPKKIAVKDDTSLNLSFSLTLTFIFITVIILTVIISRKKRIK